MNPSLIDHIIAGNWMTLFHPPLAQVGLMLVALIGGAIIGSDREKREKPAGLRTLILVSLGSAGFTMAGIGMTSGGSDPARIAAQVVTGIGFLGAGVILHPRGSISGATTAASIWVTAAVGMIAATGYAGGALGVSLLTRFVLAGVSVHEERMSQRLPPTTMALDFLPDEGLTRVRLERILSDYQPWEVQTHWQPGGDGMERVTLEIRLARHHLRDLMADLVDVPEVKRVKPV